MLYKIVKPLKARDHYKQKAVIQLEYLMMKIIKGFRLR